MTVQELLRTHKLTDEQRAKLTAAYEASRRKPAVVDKQAARKAYLRAYYLAHREQLMAYYKNYYRENIERFREYNRAYYQEHKVKVKTASRKRYFAKREEAKRSAAESRGCGAGAERGPADGLQPDA